MSRFTVPTDSLVVHLGVWLYRLRMCRAHLQDNGLLLQPEVQQYLLDTINDLLEACEDGAAWVQGSTELLEAEAEARLGKDLG